MSRRAIDTAGFALATILVLGAIGVAGADEPLELRWIPAGNETALSGIPLYPDHSEHVRINATMSTKTTDRYYAIRGVRTAGTNFSISVVPAFLHPDAERNVTNSWFAYKETSNMKSAELPEGYFLTALQICDKGGSTGSEIRGVRVWGHRLDSLGRTIDPTGPVEFTRSTGCKEWRPKVSCPSGTIAHSLRYYALAALSLVCAKVEPAVGVWNPWSGQVLDGGYFKDATGKIHVKLRTKNDSHTTGNVELAEVKLMSGGAAVCQDKYSAGPAIPYGNYKDVDIGIPCDWAKIKAAGGAACKLGDSCSVKLKGVIKARTEGLLEEHPYETTVTINHIP